LRSVFARIYRVYGRGSRDVISRWVRAALRGEELRVYNPENRFDYIFAGDVAEGLLRLGLAPEARGVVNLGSGNARCVREVTETLQKLLPDSQSKVLHSGSTAPFEASCADLARLRQLLRWRPGITLESGMRLICDYERQRAAQNR
jgi:carbamoyl-phosphate synthase large subunit